MKNNIEESQLQNHSLEMIRNILAWENISYNTKDRIDSIISAHRDHLSTILNNDLRRLWDVDRIDSHRYNEINDIFIKIFGWKLHIWEQQLFSSLNTFFSTCFPEFDLTIYKYSKTKEGNKWTRKLEPVFNNDENKKHINLGATDNESALMEKKAIRRKGVHMEIEDNWETWDITCRLSIPLGKNKFDVYVLSFEFKNLDDVLKLKKELAVLKLSKFISEKNILPVIEWKLESLNSNIDGLTGLYNKNYVEIIKDKPYSLISIDVNDFKQYNDSFWHLEWDHVLSEIWALLRDSIRWNDKACRNWWDEFLIFVDTLENPDWAIVILETIKQRLFSKLNYLNINKEKAKRYDLTIWYSIYDINKTFKQRYEEADNNMYLDKPVDWKRNRIISQIREFMINENPKESISMISKTISTIMTCGKQSVIDAFKKELSKYFNIK